MEGNAMKLDTSKEQEALERFAKRADAFGKSAQSAGQKVMGFGCALMLLGGLGLILLVVIF